MELRKDQVGYWSGNLLVSPYVTDSTLALAYLTFERDKLLDRIFHEKRPNLRWFLDTFSKDNIDVLSCSRLSSDGKSLQLCGVGWINTGFGNKVEVCEAFGREFWGHDMPLHFCWLMLQWLFDHQKGTDVVYGTTPVPNRIAAAFSRKVGFTLHGPLPLYSTYDGQPCDCWVSSLTRKQWEQMGIFQEQAKAAA